MRAGAPSSANSSMMTRVATSGPPLIQQADMAWSARASTLHDQRRRPGRPSRSRPARCPRPATPWPTRRPCCRPRAPGWHGELRQQLPGLTQHGDLGQRPPGPLSDFQANRHAQAAGRHDELGRQRHGPPRRWAAPHAASWHAEQGQRLCGRAATSGPPLTRNADAPSSANAPPVCAATSRPPSRSRPARRAWPATARPSRRPLGRPSRCKPARRARPAAPRLARRPPGRRSRSGLARRARPAAQWPARRLQAGPYATGHQGELGQQLRGPTSGHFSHSTLPQHGCGLAR